MDRRDYVRALATVGIAGVAGCGGPGAEEVTTTGEGATPAGDGETPVETEANGTQTAGNQTAENQTGTVSGAGGEGATIQMVTDGSEYYYDPIGLAVEPGATVTWVNQSGAHSSTAYTEDNPQSEVRRIPPDAQSWNSETLSESGAEFSHTFEVEGTYDYYCIPHKSLEMIGRIVVGQPGDVSGDPPDGSVPSAERIAQTGAISYAAFQS